MITYLWLLIKAFTFKLLMYSIISLSCIFRIADRVFQVLINTQKLPFMGLSMGRQIMSWNCKSASTTGLSGSNIVTFHKVINADLKRLQRKLNREEKICKKRKETKEKKKKKNSYQIQKKCWDYLRKTKEKKKKKKFNREFTL